MALRHTSVPGRMGRPFPWKVTMVVAGMAVLMLAGVLIGTQLGARDASPAVSVEQQQSGGQQVGVNPAVEKTGQDVTSWGAIKGSAADVQNGEPRDIYVTPTSAPGTGFMVTRTNHPTNPNSVTDGGQLGLSFVLMANAGHIDEAMKYMDHYTVTAAQREQIRQAALQAFYTLPSLENQGVQYATEEFRLPAPYGLGDAMLATSTLQVMTGKDMGKELPFGYNLVLELKEKKNAYDRPTHWAIVGVMPAQ